MTPEPNSFQKRLTKRLADCQLADRITFDQSALDELLKISGENRQYVDDYAGMAVLNALDGRAAAISLDGRTATISRDDIKAVDTPQVVDIATQLRRCGKSFWNDIQYLGTQRTQETPGPWIIPWETPRHLRIIRELYGWDPYGTGGDMDFIKAGRLPSTALPDLVQYDEKSRTCRWSNVRMQFHNRTIFSDTVRDIARHFSSFITQYTLKSHTAEDISRYDSMYLVRPLLLESISDYRVTSHFTFDPKGDHLGIVTILQAGAPPHEPTTLEAYARRVRSEIEYRKSGFLKGIDGVVEVRPCRQTNTKLGGI